MISLSNTEKFVAGFIIGAILIVTFQRNYQLALNRTPSLPYTMFLIKKGEAVGRGDLVAFRWRGGLGYPRDATMIKIVAAGAGELVSRQGQSFIVNGSVVATALERTRRGQPVEAAPGGIVPAHQLFVVATNPISLDSRYHKFGNVNESEVIGRAYVIF